MRSLHSTNKKCRKNGYIYIYEITALDERKMPTVFHIVSIAIKSHVYLSSEIQVSDARSLSVVGKLRLTKTSNLFRLPVK